MIKKYFEEKYPQLQLLEFSLLKGGKINLEENTDYYLLLFPVYFDVIF